VIFKRKALDTAETTSSGLWQLAMRRLKADRIAIISLFVVLCYFVMLLLSMTGVIASNWNKVVAVSYASPPFLAGRRFFTRPTTPCGR